MSAEFGPTSAKFDPIPTRLKSARARPAFDRAPNDFDGIHSGVCLFRGASMACAPNSTNIGGRSWPNLSESGGVQAEVCADFGPTSTANADRLRLNSKAELGQSGRSSTAFRRSSTKLGGTSATWPTCRTWLIRYGFGPSSIDVGAASVEVGPNLVGAHPDQRWQTLPRLG